MVDTARHSAPQAPEPDRRPDRFLLTDFLRLMLFADAVGCSKRMCAKIVDLLDVCVAQAFLVGLPLGSTLPNEGGGAPSVADGGGAPSVADGGRDTLKLDLATAYTFASAPGKVTITAHGPYYTTELVGMLPDETALGELRCRLADQLEQLLYIAFKLDLHQLAGKALHFMQLNCRDGNGILALNEGDLLRQAVLTPRVLQAAGGVVGKELLLGACLQRPLVFQVLQGAVATMRIKLMQDVAPFQVGEELVANVNFSINTLTLHDASYNYDSRGRHCSIPFLLCSDSPAVRIARPDVL